MSTDDLLDTVGKGHDFFIAVIIAVLLFPFFLLGLAVKVAQGMNAGTAETLQAAQAEGRQPGGEAMRPYDGRADKEKGAGQ